jgi:energy-coupling factor transporter ATP-binding protein EcfA2
MKPAVFRNYSMTYSLGAEPALRCVDLEIGEGELLVICGPSGCGKSTLLLSLKAEVAPVGRTSGSLCVSIPSKDIAIVFQSPETQLVTSSVINDLSFHMENLGFGNTVMKKRMAETVGFFGIEELLHKSPGQLSGGQKQLVALCAAMMTQPRLLLLDEPVSQLDPIAAKQFLETVQRINEEFGVTVVMTEHRLDETISIADRIALLEGGALRYIGMPGQVVQDIWKSRDKTAACFIPSVPRAALAVSGGERTAFTPRQFREAFLDGTGIPTGAIPPPPGKKFPEDRARLVEAKSVIYKYPAGSGFVLKKLDMALYEGEFACLMGGNGSGKSTLLKAIAGIIRPYMGSLRRTCRKSGYMPQDLNTFFMADTVGGELEDARREARTDDVYYRRLVDALELRPLFDRHPYDISGGEQQKTALAAILLGRPDLILLDEPTKGLDPGSKIVAARLLRESKAAVLAATHDLEFAAGCADRCMMLFDGDVAFHGPPREFFSENRYYTTGIGKALGRLYHGAIKYEDVIGLWEIEKPSFISGY